MDKMQIYFKQIFPLIAFFDRIKFFLILYVYSVSNIFPMCWLSVTNLKLLLKFPIL